MIDVRLYTADFPWFFVVLIIFYAVKFLSKNEKDENVPPGKKIKRPIPTKFEDVFKKVDIPQPKTITKPSKDTHRETHKPKMSDERHSNPMHQEVYKGKYSLQYDNADVELMDDSLEKSVETLSEAISKGKYGSGEHSNSTLAKTIRLNKKSYSPKELILIQTILERKY